MPTSLAVAGAGALISAGANRLLAPSGGGGPNIGPSFATGGQISAPSGRIVLDNSGPIFARSNLTQNLLDEIRSVGEGAVSGFDDLIGRVRPGFGELTDARVAAVDRARGRGVSNLRSNLQRRSLLGSSFAQDTIIRAEREFAEQEAMARAQSLLEELDLTARLIDTRTNQALRAATIELDQGNFELGTTASVLSGVQSAMTSAAQTQAQLAAANASGLGEFLGFNLNDSLAGAADSIDTFIDGLLSPSGSGGR